MAKLARLSRSLVDFAGLMAQAQAGGWNLVALDLGIDLATPATFSQVDLGAGDGTFKVRGPKASN